MWNNYFFQLQKKYNMRISTKMPLVVRFDGRQVTKNEDINLLDNYNGSFFDSLEKTAKFFSEKYHCFAIFGSDEISFIILEPNLVIEDLEPADKTQHAQELIVLFSQYFFDYFNHFDMNRKIFWHGKCFSIPEGKVSSYIKYRSGTIKNVMVTYFAKKNNINHVNLNLDEKLAACKASSMYEVLKSVENGTLYYDGEKIDLMVFLDDGIIRKLEVENGNNERVELFDVDDIDIEMI